MELHDTFSDHCFNLLLKREVQLGSLELEHTISQGMFSVLDITAFTAWPPRANAVLKDCFKNLLA